MKKTKLYTILILVMAIIMGSVISVHASGIPREAIPENTPQDAVDITEGYIHNVLDKVQNGMGYADAKAESNRILFKAFINNQTGGYSYGLLTIIANNAIFEYRDIYLRPNVYQEYEEIVKILLADLIVAVENGTMSYRDAKKEAYTRIYQSVDATYNPDERAYTDFCYWDVVSVDGAMFNRARKVLLEAQQRYQLSPNQVN